MNGYECKFFAFFQWRTVTRTHPWNEARKFTGFERLIPILRIMLPFKKKRGTSEFQ